MKRVPATFLRAVQAHRNRLERVLTVRNVANAKQLYEDAQASLQARIRRTLGAGRGDTFTAHQQRIMLTQLRQGQSLIGQRMAGNLNGLTKVAQETSMRGLVDDVSRLNKFFTGSELTLPVEEAAVFRGLIDRRATSMLVQQQASMARYGAHLVDEVQKKLSVAVLTQEPVHEVYDDVAAAIDKEWYWGERIVRTECLPGDTLVSGAVVRAAHRRWYEGPMVEVITHGGRKFSATPNHPMLTQGGWVAAGQLHQADYLVCYQGDKRASSPGDENVAAPPATIAQVFDAVAAVGVSERRRGAKPDFHGDGSNRDVHVQRTHRELALGVFAPLTEPLGKQLLAPPHSARARFCRRCQHLLLVTERCGFCDSSSGQTRFSYPCVDQAVAYLQRLRDLVRALASPVALNHLFDWYILTQPWVFASAGVEGEPCFVERPHLAGLAHHPPNPGRPEAGALGHLGDAEAREVQFDNVKRVSVREFRGHVFNLSTTHGYYAINGVYTGNTAYAYNVTHRDGISESAKEIPELMQQWQEHCADDGSPLDDRVAVDSLAMHGQVAPAGGLFTMPPRAPNPDKKGNYEVPDALVGLQWAFPPNRSNDRAVISPWMEDWGVPGWRWLGGERVWLNR